MKWRDQQLMHPPRYAVIPRTLAFLTHDDALLLLRGAPTKRLWANRLNGIGGQIEPGETPLEGAQREILEETGLEVDALTLRAIVHVDGRDGSPGVIFFVYVGEASVRATTPSGEGALEWWPLDALPWDQMVADLPHLLPLTLAPQEQTDLRIIYGSYSSDPEGEMRFRFESLGSQLT